MSFQDDAHGSRHTGYFLPKITLEDYNFMGKTGNDEGKIYENIRK